METFKDQFIQTFSATPKDDQSMTSAYSDEGNQFTYLAGVSKAPKDEEDTIGDFQDAMTVVITRKSK